MRNDDAREGADRSSEADEAERRADERSIIPGPRSFGGANIASTEAEQTRDHTERRGPGPHDEAGLEDEVPPGAEPDADRRD